MLGNQGDSGKRTSLHGHWSSRMAFILAVTGSAVGLGNMLVCAVELLLAVRMSNLNSAVDEGPNTVDRRRPRNFITVLMISNRFVLATYFEIERGRFVRITNETPPIGT